MTGIERRLKTNNIIKNMGIACYEELPTIEESKDVTLKSIDKVCKRAIASIISINVACDALSDNYENGLNFFKPLLVKYDVENCLNSLERKLFDNNFDNQDAINIGWEYEIYWSLVWALGLVDDISDASNICDCEKANLLIKECDTFEDFRNKCKLRDIEEILDMLDLYYRYNWATVEKSINPNTNIGTLNPEIVIERRRGLEWLISDEEDWFDISLDT